MSAQGENERRKVVYLLRKKKNSGDSKGKVDNEEV